LGSFNLQVPKKTNIRKEKDVHKLLVSKFDVTLPKENDTSELRVNFKGPEDSPYKDVSINICHKFYLICYDIGVMGDKSVVAK
jgi:ubiquitin-protein ligase